MNKKNLVLPFFLFIISSANSQITKGNWMVGGSATYVSATNTTNGAVVAEGKTTNFSIIPRIAYFPLNKFATGISLGYLYGKQSDILSNYVSKTESIGGGPFLRYYFFKPEKIVNLFAEANFSYSHSIDNNGIDSRLYAYGIGTVIYFNSSVGLELIAKNWHLSTVDNVSKSNQIKVEIGFQIHLEK